MSKYKVTFKTSDTEPVVYGSDDTPTLDKPVSIIIEGDKKYDETELVNTAARKLFRSHRHSDCITVIQTYEFDGKILSYRIDTFEDFGLTLSNPSSIQSERFSKALYQNVIYTVEKQKESNQ